VDRLGGFLLLLPAFVLVVHNKELSVWQNRSVQRRTGGHFAHDDWRRWNRIVFYLVAAFFAVAGVATLLGLDERFS
jgi:hypothetical protein